MPGSRILRATLVGLTGFACRFPRLAVAVSLVLTIAGGVYLAEFIAIDTSTDKMLSEDLPHRRLDRELNAAFPTDPDSLLVVVEGDTPDLANDAAILLTDVLKGRPDLFRSVYEPAGDPFFRRNGLLYASTDELYELSDRLAAAQPFLGALWRDRSLRGLFEMLTLAIEESAKGDTGAAIDVTGVLERVAEIAEAQAEGRFAQLSWMRLMTGANEDGPARRYILVQAVLDFSELRPAQAPIETIRSIASNLGYDGSRGVRVRLTGTIALNDDELQSVTLGMGAAGTLSLVLVVTLLVVGLRSPRLTVAALATLFVGLVWTAAFAIAALGALNLISVAFAVLFIGLSVDFSIHYGLRYREEWETEHEPCRNLRRTVEGIGGALVIGAFSAAIGFLSFVPTEYVGLAELGIVAGAGMIIAVFLTLTFLPALIMLLRPQLGKPVDWETDWQAKIGRIVGTHARPVALTSLILGLGAAALLPRVHFDFDPLNLKNPETESVATLLDLMADEPTESYSLVYLAESLAEADRLAATVRGLPTIDSTRTASDFVPAEQDEKLATIADLALILEPSLRAARVPPPTRSETLAALEELQDALRSLATKGDETEQAAAQRLLNGLDALSTDALYDRSVWKQFEARLLAGLPRRLEALRESLWAERIGFEDLPDQVRERWIAPDGRARLEIYPSKNIHRNPDALRAFVADVRSVIPNVVGNPVEILDGGRAVIRSLLDAAGIAVIAISIMLLALIRRVRDTLVVFAPLVLAALFTIAASVLLAIPFNFANVIVLPLLFGLGVAGSLHLVMRQRKERETGDVMSTSTPRAVMFSALTTIASFSTLSLSEHPGTASMGVLLTIALVLTTLCTLVVLPAVMVMAGIERPRIR